MAIGRARAGRTGRQGQWLGQVGRARASRQGRTRACRLGQIGSGLDTYLGS